MKFIVKSLCLITGLFLFSTQLSAQLNPMASQYFQNPYLANPAMAGSNQGLRLNMGYRSQWNAIQGSPKNTTLTADYRSKNVGLGFSFYKDQAGLIDRTKFAATYAYYVPLNGESKSLSFGLSLGIQNENLNNQAIVGSGNDQAALDFNDRETMLDGDFGVTYTSKNLTIEGVLNNLKKQFKDEDWNSADFSTFYSVVTYQINFRNLQFSPKLAYRRVRNFKDIFDIGGEIKTNNEQLGFITLYHTSKNFTLGMSYEHNKQWQLLAVYNTPTNELKNNTNGSFELGFQLKLTNLKK